VRRGGVVGQHWAHVEAEQPVDGGQQRGVRGLGGGGPDLQGGAVAAGEGQAGVGEAVDQWAQGLEALLHPALDQGEQLPGQFYLVHLDGGVLELWLAGQRVAGRQGQDVGAQPFEEPVAPVHRQPGLAGTQAVIGLHGEDQAAAPAAYPHQLAGTQAAPTQFVRM